MCCGPPITGHLVVVDVGLGDALPLGPRGGAHDGGEADGEEVPRLAQVHDVEDDPLVGGDILHREVEPEPDNRHALSRHVMRT